MPFQLWLLAFALLMNVGSAQESNDDLQILWSKCFENVLPAEDIAPAIQCVALGSARDAPDSLKARLAIRFKFVNGDVKQYHVDCFSQDTVRGLDDPDQHTVFVSHILGENAGKLVARNIFIYFLRWDNVAGQVIEFLDGRAPTGQSFKLDHPKFPFQLFN